MSTVTFGPVSVLPGRQGKGVGSALIKESLGRAKELGFKVVVIMGHPSYYHRFGFKASKYFNVKS